MAKAKSPSRKPTPGKQRSTKVQDEHLLDLLGQRTAIMVFFAGLLGVLIWLYSPIVVDGLDVQGSDVISGIGNTKQVKAHEALTGHKPLWNPNVFSGMPVYHRHNAISWSVDTFISNILDTLLDWRIWYLFLGAVGMFLLASYLGLHPLAGMLAALAFVLIPHFHALIVVGHFSKLRAIMWMPWVLLSFLFLLNRRTLLGMFSFTFVFALMMRTQHYQIIFYTILLLMFTGFYPYLKLVLAKNWSEFLKFNGMLIGAIGLVVMIVAQPLFVTKDYTPFSTRGGNAIKLNEKVSQQDKKGVGFDYATNWSYTTTEFWNLIIPKFHGGTSQELYTGNAVPQFKNRVLPMYWGDLPLTQSLEYLGVLIAFLAAIGMVFCWGNPFVKGLSALTIFALLLSLGKHFAALYKLFFYYLPFFDKFRVPMMILTLVAFNACILAAIGFDHIISGKIEWGKAKNKLYVIAGIFGVLLIYPIIFGSGFSLSPAGELQRYAAQQGQQAQQLIAMFKKVRLETLTASTWRSLIFFIMGSGLFFATLRGWMQKQYAVLGIFALILFDLGIISGGYLDGKFINRERAEVQTYGATKIDLAIKKDKSLYRVLPPLRQVASDSRWPYHHQSIGGYSAAKTQVIQDIITNNLITRANPTFPLNLNVISMLNGKYLALNQRLQHVDLEYITNEKGIYLFKNNGVLPRAFFVGKTQVFTDGPDRLKFMNSNAFAPGETALLEKEITETIAVPDSNSSITVSDFQPDKIVVDYRSNVQTLVVLSEVFYPKGWHATLEDGKALEILKTNHIIRSMVVPAGKHTITLVFEPQTYYTGVMVSWLGWLITYAGFFFLGYQEWKRKQVAIA